MSQNIDPNTVLEERIAARSLEVLIRAGFILAMAVLCYAIFAPFLALMLWGLILAVTFYPLQQKLAARIGGRQGAAASVVVLLGCMLLVVPTAVLMAELGDSIHQLIHEVQHDALHVPPPPERIAALPLVGERIHDAWQLAHDNLPAFIKSLQPQIGNLAKGALGFVASIGSGVLLFLGALVVAGIIMAFGQGGAQAMRTIFVRIAGRARGEEFVRLATATIRTVAQGVVGVALIQALVVGLCLLVAGVPWAGVLALLVLVLAIAQIPVLLVTLPAIAYLWMSGHYSNGEAILYTILLVLAGVIDNVLKPILLGRGVEAPMPVILLGALGGMAVSGILGLFVGATLLALGYQIFMGWVAEKPEEATVIGEHLPL